MNVITELHAADKRVKGISLAHNRGHQYALLAGLMAVRDRCDAAISIDADLQDDPEAIVKMVQEFRKGKEIVYGVRSVVRPTRGSSALRHTDSTAFRR